MSFVNTTSYGQYLNSVPADQRDAFASAQALFNEYGVDIASQVEDWAIQGYSADQMELMAKETPQYQTRFSANIERQKQGLAPISPAEYVSIERGYEQALSSVGINPNFLSRDQMAKMIANDKSPTELQSQITNTYQKISSDPALAGQFQTLYGQGVTPGELAAYFLDPDHTEQYLTQQVTAAELASRAKASGFGQLDKTQAEGLASQGVTASQAAQGFGNLAQQKALLDPLASESGAISNDTAISAQFDNNADAQNRLKKRLQNRQADFAGGGNFTDPNKSGLTGAGTSNA